MEAGLRISWGKVVKGYRKEAIELFEDASTYYGKKLADGKITFFEPFFVSTGDQSLDAGFFIVKAPVQEIFTILGEAAFKELNTKAYFLLEHFRYDILVAGDEVLTQLKLFEDTGLAYQA